MTGVAGRLRDRVAIVTGGGSGIARATAHAFAREGASVVVLEIDQASGRAVEGELREITPNAVFVRTDVTDPEQVRQAVDGTVQRFGQLDVLFNCAGGSVLEDAMVHEMDVGVWQRTMALNLRSRVSQEQPGAAVLIGVKDGKVAVVAATNDRARERGVRADHVLAAVMPLVGGRGGGKDDVAQGGGTDSSRSDEGLDAARTAIAQAVGAA